MGKFVTGKEATMPVDSITISLSKQQALVLFEWLANLEETLQPSAFQHPAEEKVLWAIQGQLESTLTEPFAASYKAILEEARKNVEVGNVQCP